MKKLYILVVFLTLLINANTLFGQAAGAPIVNINSGNPKFPFPQFLDYTYTGGHSLGNLGTTNAPGVVHAEMEKTIREGWQIMMNRGEYLGPTVDGVKYIHFKSVPDCSEGDGYAMLAAAYMADKTIFDGLWFWIHDNRVPKVERYSDCVQNAPGYSYSVLPAWTGTSTTANSASDGDFDIALALYVAYKQWGEFSGHVDGCGRAISYKAALIEILKGMTDTFTGTAPWGICSGDIGLDGYFKGGDTWTELTNWASATLPYVKPPEFGGPSIQHIDYTAPSYFNEFEDFLTTENATLYNWNISQFRKAEASSDWLFGKWVQASPINIPVGGWVDLSSGSPVFSVFITGGEDFRAPWRSILNYVWHGNPTDSWNPTSHTVVAGGNTFELEAGQRMAKFLNNPQATPWNNSCADFGGGPDITYKGSSTIVQYSPTGAGSGFTLNWTEGTSAAAAVAAEDFDLMGQLYRQCVIEWDVAIPGDGYLTSVPVYFHGFFRQLGMLTLSGNLQAPSSMNPKSNLKIYRDIQLGKTFAYTGDNITYILTYRNYGSVDATGTKIVEKVPVDFSFISATNGGVYDAATHTVTWTIGTVTGFKTGALAATQGTVSYTTKINSNATGRYCTTADITCTNGLGWTSNEFPNDVSATMRRNCVDVIARALKIEKTADRTKANEGNLVTYTINFENSVEAGWIDGGRPGVDISFAHPVLATPTAIDQSGIKIRLFHDAVEPYIDYGNYRISYFINDPGLTCYVGNAGCTTGWAIDLGGAVYEGGLKSGLKVTHELITPGSDARGSWNQRLIVQFAPLLVTTTPHLSNYFGMGARIHQGGTEPLRLSMRVFPSNYNATNWADDWSWDAGAGDDDAGLYFPVTPDWTDPANPAIPVTKWHQHSCETATKTVDNVLVEEFDGYVWRRILGNGPIPGRDITNVIIKDTLPTGLTFGAFVGANPFGIAPTVTTIAGGKQVITWSIPKLQAKQKGSIVFTGTVDFPSGANCPAADENLINKAWIQGDNESAIGDTAKVIVTCTVIPTVIKPTTLKKTADKTTYAIGDNITYTLNYEQTHGSIVTNAATLPANWTLQNYSFSGTTLTAASYATPNSAIFNTAYGKNGFVEYLCTPGTYVTHQVLFREGSGNTIKLLIKSLNTGQLEVTAYKNSTLVQATQSLTYGGGSPYTVRIDLNNDLLRLWINNDTINSPIYSVSGLPIGVGKFGFSNGNFTGGDAGGHSFSNIYTHFDYAYDLVITDPIPSEISYTSATNSGTNNAGTVTWTNLATNPIAPGTQFTVSWTGKINTCNTILENIAYVKMMGYTSNAIAGQAVVNCGASCPSAPTVITPVNYCKGATASALTATGTALKWYTVAIGGTALASAPTPSTGTIGTTPYYVSQTANGCESTRALINVVVTETAAPTVITPINYCKDATAIALTATGTDLKWYTVATSGTSSTTAPTPLTSTVGTTPYYVSQTLNSCESARALINVVVTETAAPTVTTPINYCKDATAIALTATGTALKWYTVATGGTSSTIAPTPLTTSAGTTPYYVSQTLNSCESARALINVVVIETAAPTVTTPVNYCKDATAIALTATGTALKWYNVATGGTSSATAPTPSTGTTGTTPYYVSQTLNSCESTRALINVVITETAAPTVTTPVNYCKDATANALTATGTDLKWYTVATGGTSSTTAPTPLTTTAGTTPYYVSQTLNSCESARALINVVVTETAAPTVITPITYCKDATAIALTATGTDLKWYTVATGGTSSTTAPTPFTTSAGTTPYYVSQTLNSCESTRALINVIINETTAPTVTTPVNYCKDATAIALTATGTALKWYTAATGGTSNSTAPTPNTTTVGTTPYYVSQTLNSCESTRALINVVVTETAAPTVITPITYCKDATAIALTATGTDLKWYTVATGGTSSTTAPTPLTTTAGTTPYYVSQTLNSCESARAIINVIINETTAPTVTTPVNYCKDATATALTATGTDLKWYTIATGGTSSTIAPTPLTTSAGTTPYYVSQTLNSCESTRTLINVVVYETSAPIVITPVDYCKDATAIALTATGTALKWYTVATAGTALASAPTPSTGTIGTTPYYVSQTLNSCESPRAIINVVVAEPTTPTVTSPISYCQTDIATALTATGTGLTWYTVSTSGIGSTIAPVPSTITDGTTSYYVSQKIGLCESPRAEIQVIVKPKPVITFNSVSPLCEDATPFTLNATATPIGGTGSFTGNGVTGTTFTPATAGINSHTITYDYSLNSCSSSASISIDVQAKPTVDFTLPVSACNGGSTIALTGTPIGGTFTTTPSIDVSAGFNPSLATPNQAYSITYSYSNGVCSNSISKSITVYNPAKPVGTNASEVYTLVPPVPSLSATGIGQIWYSDAALLTQVGTGATYTPSSTVVTNGTEGIPGIYTYYVVSTEGGCTSASTPVSLTITTCSAVAPTPVNSVVEMCFGDTDPAHKTLAINATGNNNIWYFGGVEQQNSTLTSFVPSQTAVGSYTFEVSQFDGGESCESPRSTVTLIINALPTVSFTPPSAVCKGSTYIDFTPYKSQATGIVTCIEAASTCTGFDPATAGTYNFSYSYTNPTTTCINTTTSQILVRALPQPIFSAITDKCEYDAQFSLTPLVDLTGGVFSGTGVVGNNFNPALVTPGTSSTISYVYTDGNSCSNTVTSSVTVNAKPAITFSTIPSSCIGGSAFDLLQFVTPKTGTFTGTGVSGTNYNPSTDGSFAITYSVTTTGCTNTATQNAVVNVLPSVTISSVPSIICHNESIVTPVISPTGTILKLNGSIITSINPTLYTGGTYMLTYEYTNPTTNCSTNNTATGLPIEIRKINSPTVGNKSIVLNSTDLSISAIGGSGTLTWKNASNVIVGTGTSINHPSSATVGSWNYCVTETDGTCTSDAACMIFTVTSCTTPAPSVTPATISICNGDAIPTFTASGTGTVTWYDNTNTAIHTGNTFTPTITAGATGTFIWTVTLTDICEGPPTTISLTINALPTITLTTNAVECINTGTITPTLNPIGGTFTINSVTATDINTNTLTAGNYTLEYEYQNPTTLCENSVSKSLEIREIASPGVSNKTTLISSPDLSITTTSDNGGTLTWRNAGNSIVGTGTTMTHPLVPTVGSWQYCVTESDGTCSSIPACMTFAIINCPTPAPTVVNPIRNICDGDAIPTFTATGTGTMNWYDNTNTIVYTGTSFTPIITAGTIGTFNWTVAATDGCEGPTTPISLTINSLPTVSITTNAVECINTGSKTPMLIPSGGIFKINGIVATSISTSLVGNYVLTYEYQNPTTLCTNTATTGLEIRAVMQPMASNVTKLITDTDFSMSTTMNSGGTLTWKNSSNVIVGTGTTLIHPLTPSIGSWQYCVTESDGTCSSLPACITFAIIDCPVPAPTVTNATRNICNGDAIPAFTASGTGTMNWYDNTNTIVYTGNTFTPTITTGATGTFTWTVTATDVCEGPGTTISLTINALPTITLTTNDVECINTGTKTPTLNPIGGIFTINGITATNINTNTLIAGNYTLEYEYQNPTTLCINSATKSLEIREIPSPGVDNKTTLISSPDLIISTTSDNGGTLTWKNAANLVVGTGTSMTHPLAPIVGNWQYCVTETDGTCSSVPTCMTFAIINCPVPAPTVPTPFTTACLNEPIPTLIANGTETIRWYAKADPNTIIYTGNSFTPSIISAGLYEYYVAQFDGTCEGLRESVKLEVKNTTSPSLSTPPQRCVGTTIMISAQLEPGQFYWYSIDPSITPSTPIENNSTHTVLGTSTTPIELWVVRENDGCKSNPTKTTYTFTGLPIAPTITGNDVCSGQTITYQSSDTDIKYYALLTDIIPLQSGSDTYSIPYALGTSNTIFATQTVNGCESQKASKTVTIKPNPTAPANQTKSICSYDAIPTFSVSGEPTGIFNWYSDAALLTHELIGTSYTPSINASQTRYVTQTVNGCTSLNAGIMTFNVKPQPAKVTFRHTTDVTICEGESITMGVWEFQNIKWYDSPDITATSIATGQYYMPLNITIGSTTLYATQTINGCESEKNNKDIIMVAGPSAPNIITEAEICAGDSPAILKVSTNSPNESVSWINNKGEILGLGLEYTVPVSETPSAGNYTFYARTSVSGCPYDSYKQTALQYQVFPTPNPPTVKQTAFCYNENEITLSARGSEVTWYDENQIAIPQCLNKENCIPGISNIGNYNFYVGQKTGECESELSKLDIIISEIPKPEIIGEQYVCANTTEIYSISKFDNSNTLSWYVSGNRTTYQVSNTESGFTRSVDWIEPGLDTIFVSEKNIYNCVGTTLLPVYVTPIPDAQFVTENTGEEGIVQIINTSEPQTLIEGDSIVEFPVDYFWNFGRQTDDKLIQNNNLKFKESYNYGPYEISLTAVNETGCSNTISNDVFVDMKFGLYIPNAFSPTNPALGVRTFKPRGFNMTEFKISIFDTWGNLIWYSEGVDENGSPLGEWDGISSEGEILQAGVYIWKIDATFVNGQKWKGLKTNTNKETKFGNIILIR